MNSKLVVVAGIVCVVGVILGVLLLADGTHGATNVNDVINDTYIEPNETIEEVPVTYNVTISTDKYTYKSKGRIQMTVNMTVSQAVEGVDLRIRGVMNKMKSYKVKKNVLNMTLEEGFNQKRVNATVPSCYGCAAISPGVYEMKALLFENGTNVANATTEIEIVK